MLGATVLVKMLESYGVQYVFGLPGDTSVDLYDSLSRSTIRHILCRDERSGGYMADGYARFSGRPGVTDAPSGGGAAYVFPAVSEADGSSIPLIALTTDISLRSENKQTLTALDQVACYRSACRFSTRITRGDLIPHNVRMAFRAASGGRMGSAHLCLPEDVLSTDAGDVDDLYAQPECASYPAWRVRPPWASVEEVVKALFEAERPLILAGGGVLLSKAQDELLALAELLGIGVVTSIDGKGAIRESHPLALGVVGGNGGKEPSNQAVSECDLLLAVGTRLNSTTTFGGNLLAHKPRLVHVDVDPQQLGCNSRAYLSLMGDAAATLADLLECARHSTQPRPRWARWAAEWQKAIGEDARPVEATDSWADTIHPAGIVDVLKRVLPNDAIVACDAGTATPFVMAYYPATGKGRTILAARTHGSLGYALPAALGARLARPSSHVVVLVGDGSLAMSFGELETLSRVGGQMTVILLRNNTFGWIKMLQKLYFGERYFSVDFSPDTGYVGVAKAMGIRATVVSSSETFEQAVVESLSRKDPSFVEVRTADESLITPPVAAWLRDERMTPEQRRRRSY